MSCVAAHFMTRVQVLVGTADGQLQLWNFRSGRLIHKFSLPNSPRKTTTSIVCIAQSPVVDVVALGCDDGRIILHNIRADKVRCLSCFVLSCVRFWNDISCGTTHRQLQSCVMRPTTGQPGESRRCRFAQTCSTTPRCWRREPRPAASLCGIWMSDLCCRIFPMRMMVA